MHTAAWPIPLVPLFAALLSGCVVGSSSCDDFKPGGTFEREVELTPENYKMYQVGVVPGDTTTTADPTTSGGSTTSESTTSESTTGESTTGESTTGESTTGAGTTGESTTGAKTGGVMLSDEDTCALVCEHESGGFGEPQSCSTSVEADNVVVTCVYPIFCEGRRHACVASRGDSAGLGPAARWLARAAHDEAASVHAFRALGRELAALGAPAELLARIDAAACDELRHAEVTAELARSHGAEVAAPVCAQVPARDLLALAIENAVEGCVRETWAALSAAHQAQFAVEAAVREIYTRIAADEARHAELAWAIDAWLCGQLDRYARAEVAAARGRAVVELAMALTGLDARPLRGLGVPSSATAARLCAGLDAALWSQAA